jgi:hypothetical protein
MVITTLVCGDDLNLFAANINTRILERKREEIYSFLVRMLVQN